jgi:hypothetical protein
MFLYILTNFAGRPTMDIDFLMRRISNDIAGIEQIMKSICEVDTGNDFITMEVLRTKEITPETEYPSVGINLLAHIKNVRIPFSIDIGVDDIIIQITTTDRDDVQLGSSGDFRKAWRC